MSEILIKKEYIIEELTPGEVMLLTIINMSNKKMFNRFCKIYKNHLLKLLEKLQLNFYIKNNSDEEIKLENIILRQKSLDLFKERTDINFDEFWEKFHELTGRTKTDKVPAKRYWDALDQEEKASAIVNIKDYFDSLSDPMYCKKARTYLCDKDFSNEFEKAVQVDIINKFKIKKK